jgi:serine/threonine-protein kinase
MENGLAAGAPSGRSSGASGSDSAFLPGAVLAGRWRIVALLGRGGMGEVYRADDLELGEAVALKFLPPELAADPAAVERFRQEVRVARRVAHPNVCRVFDFGEAGGRLFLSMEYIDGEDLASLLRRIGRLPGDKGLEIARQLCAGLAAAHEQGVLHRDLKPANVMLDGRGRAKITDFGLAGLAFRPDEIHHGTPAYMAPEQRMGQEVSVRSDLYALGLVLYEVFTGRRPFDARTAEELARQQATGTPTAPSSHVAELDPLAERIILRCLEADPRRRPAAALQVAAALPGGDPLAAAVAAGETPSPEMVAAAPAQGALRPAVAGALLAWVLLLVAAGLAASRWQLHERVGLPLSPAELSFRAGEVLRAAGVTAPAADEAWGFAWDMEIVERLDTADPEAAARLWEGVERHRPPALLYWHRASPRPLRTRFLGGTRLAADDPAPRHPGETRIWLDPAGRLRTFERVPDPAAGAAAEWAEGAEGAAPFAGLLAATGLDPEALVETATRWLPPLPATRSVAWEDRSAPVAGRRVEAAAAGAAPVWLEVVDGGRAPAHAQDLQEPPHLQVFFAFIILFYLLALGLAVFLAHRNLRRNRADRRGAFRLAAFLFAVTLLSELVSAHWAPGVLPVGGVFLGALERALFFAGVVWLAYVGLEPVIRRRWPGRVIGWNRLLAGDWRDPLVGRDVLAGLALGLVMLSRIVGERVVTAVEGRPIVWTARTEAFSGWRGLAEVFGNAVSASVMVAFAALIFLVLMTFVVRRMTLSAVLFWLMFTALQFLGAGGARPLLLPFIALAAGAWVLAVARFGLLTGVAAHLAFSLLLFFSWSTRVTAWTFPTAVVPVVLVLALAGFGFVTSLGGRGALARLVPGDVDL